jgi:hypothetical protein
MIDPTIAAAGARAAALFATKAVEGAGSKAGEALTAIVGRLVDLVRHKAKEDKALEGALIVVDDDPSDETRIGMLGKLLAKRAAADPVFARELLALVDEANAAGASHTVVQSVEDVSGGEVNMAGRDIYKAGHDQIFGHDPRRR